jgi:hypothetical protein
LGRGGWGSVSRHHFYRHTYYVARTHRRMSHSRQLSRKDYAGKQSDNIPVLDLFLILLCSLLSLHLNTSRRVCWESNALISRPARSLAADPNIPATPASAPSVAPFASPPDFSHATTRRHRRRLIRPKTSLELSSVLSRCRSTSLHHGNQHG